jgi:coniferyl-aldehyde dehydrogenase
MAERREILDALLGALVDGKDRIAAAIDADFGGRSREETLQGEILPAVSFIKHARRHLAQWMRPERRAVAAKYWFGSNRVLYQPLGVVGIIAPWNYPVALSVGPLVAALAAGNRAIVRLSSRVPRTAETLGALVAGALPADFVAMAPGSTEVAKAMTELPFDHLVFTGSTEVGRKVMAAAADNLVPVTLELGGKSPAIVHPSYDIAKAASRIAWGKFFNAGQTCIAPDYAFVARSALPAFVQAVGTEIGRLYPDAPDSPDYTSVIDDGAFARAVGLVEDARAKGATVASFPPGAVANGRKLPPTLVTDAPDDARIATEEIFGPVLLVRTYDDFDEVFAHLAIRPRPLALYYFDDDRARIARMARETVSGGMAVNDVLLQFMQDDLPFGGVGASGIGRYHGFEGFAAFSSQRAVYRAGPVNLHRMVHPPYTGFMRFLLDRVTRRTPF